MRDRGSVGDAEGRGYARWIGWLLAGTVAGLLAGFAVGLGRPRQWSYGPYDRAGSA